MKKLIFLAMAAAGIFASLGLVSANALLQDDEKPSETAYLGVQIGDVSSQVMEKYDLDNRDGAYVARVMPGSPADKAGLRRGDILTAFGGTALRIPKDLTKAVQAHAVGDVVDVTFLRNGREQKLTVELGKAPDRRKMYSAMLAGPDKHVFTVKPDKNAVMFKFPGRLHLGIGYEDLNSQLGEYFERPDGSGVLVTSVESGSPAEKAGLHAGDVIIRIGNTAVNDSKDLFDALKLEKTSEDQEKVVKEIEVVRKGQRQTLSVEFEVTRAMPGFQWYRYHGKDDAWMRQHLHEGLNHLQDMKFIVPDLHFEVLENMDDFDIYVPDFELHELEMMMPELHFLEEMELMIPDFDFIEDLEYMIPEFDDIVESILLDVPEGFHFEFSDDGVVFDDRTFESMEEFRDYLKSDEFKRWRDEMESEIKSTVKEVHSIIA